jgi:hypothetical protein
MTAAFPTIRTLQLVLHLGISFATRKRKNRRRPTGCAILPPLGLPRLSCLSSNSVLCRAIQHAGPYRLGCMVGAWHSPTTSVSHCSVRPAVLDALPPANHDLCSAYILGCALTMCSMQAKTASYIPCLLLPWTGLSKYPREVQPRAHESSIEEARYGKPRFVFLGYQLFHWLTTDHAPGLARHGDSIVTCFTRIHTLVVRLRWLLMGYDNEGTTEQFHSIGKSCVSLG